jgi:HEAT repeat protein
MICKRGFPNTKNNSFRITIAQLFALALISPSISGQTAQQKNPSATELLDQFKNEKVFWRQLEVAKKIVALHDTGVLPKLVSWLNHDDRHLRGNAAFIFAGLGDDRGFEVINAILEDRSDRPQGQGQGFVSNVLHNVEQQIHADRYYAAHLFGDLKDGRAVPILVPLLSDKEVQDIVPWSLGEIGDSRADGPLIDVLDDKNPSMRVLAIYALVTLCAREALPRLRALLDDHEKANFDKQESVAEAAEAAIAKLGSSTKNRARVCEK